MALTKTTEVCGLTISIINGAIAAAHVSQVTIVKDGDVEVSRTPIHPQNVTATGPLSLAGVLDTTLSAALAGTAPLQAQIDELTATVAMDTARMADLEARLAVYEPPEPKVPQKAVQKALSKLELYDVWTKAVEITISTLEADGDKDPKRIYTWWWDSNPTLHFAEPEWVAIVAEMDKNGMWGKSSEKELIDLAREINNPTSNEVAIDTIAVDLKK